MIAILAYNPFAGYFPVFSTMMPAACVFRSFPQYMVARIAGASAIFSIAFIVNIPLLRKSRKPIRGVRGERVKRERVD